MFNCIPSSDKLLVMNIYLSPCCVNITHVYPGKPGTEIKCVTILNRGLTSVMSNVGCQVGEVASSFCKIK